MKLKILHVLLAYVLLGGIVWNIGTTVFANKSIYFNTTYWQRFPILEKVFLDSQYVNKHPKGWIPDETAFSYAGGKLIKGTNPVLVVPDAPPLGKYIIGLSTIFFGNENITNLISYIVSLILLYVLSLQILKNKTVALLPPFLLSFEKIFTNQIAYTPLLDLFQLVFLLACFLSFNKGLQSKKTWMWFLLSGVFLGCFMSTKFFISGFSIIISWFLVLFILKKWKSAFVVSFATIISLLIVPLSYLRVFAFGYTVKELLGIQKWVFLYHTGQFGHPFSVWPLLLIDRWYVWFGNKPFISDPQWSVTWPILMIILTVCIVLSAMKKIAAKKEVLVLFVWPFIYLLSLSVGEIFSRYFVILIPVLYIVAIYLLQQLWILFKERGHHAHRT